MDEKNIAKIIDNLMQLGKALAWGLTVCALIELLSGCGSTKVVQEGTTIVHDTLVERGRDSVVYITKEVLRDTMRSWVVVRDVVDERGKVIRHDSVSSTERSVDRGTASEVYKHRIDSLSRVIDKMTNEKTVVKEPERRSWWSKMCEKTGKASWLMAVVVALWMVVRRMKG